MDQDSFRQLLQTPRAGRSSVLGGGSRSRLAVPPKKPSKAADTSQPSFKPRTVKKSQDSKYRDRASERRTGDGNDYAQVEAVLDEFEKKNADEDKAKVEAQRKYLGGDSEHSILVKGLDFALLEQNKARSVLTEDDVDALDQVFLESSSHPQSSAPKKRTREDLVRELKAKREGGKSSQDVAMASSAEDEARLLEEAKQKGKFKPIGFKPIGSASDGKKKNTKIGAAEGEKRKKKKQKVNDDSNRDTNASTHMPPPPVPSAPAKQTPEPEGPVDDDFDIFAGAGDYEGIMDDDDDAHPPTARYPELEEGEDESPSNVPMSRIFDDERESFRAKNPSIPLPSILSSKSARDQLSSHHEQPTVSDDGDMDGDRPMRLVPLSSSAVPSIKDLLAMDKAAGSHDKNKKRKLKKKAGEGDEGDSESKKKPSLEEKVDRDYKRLKTYTDKKAAAEGK